MSSHKAMSSHKSSKGRRKPETPSIPRSGIDRRQFLVGSAAALMLMMGVEELRADTPAAPAAAPAGPPIGCGVIGLGLQGRALLTALAQQPGASLKAVCDTYEGAYHRALEIAPKATTYSDYHKLLDEKDVDAVFIATPTYLHHQIALDAVDAGKHVYCEAPLASSLDDAKAIALKGNGSNKIFQVGLQQRANPQVLHVRKFVQTGVLNQIAQVHSQWHKRTSWRQPAPTTDRENELNWRLHRATSLGLVGEEGLHSLDLANWFLKTMPVSVVGMGALREWGDDGRDVYDTVQCIVEYPAGINLSFDATLVSSFNSAYDLYMGSDASILLRDNRAWMFKEADAPALGWEVYARKDKIGDEEGIALVADATKQLALGKQPGDEQQQQPADITQDILNSAVAAFMNSVWTGAKPEAGAVDGYQATVVAIKAAEAIRAGSKVIFQKDWFDLA